MINWLINRTCIHAFASLFFGLFTELSNNCKRNININLHKLADWSMTTTELTKANFGFLNIYFPFNLAHSGVGSVNHHTMRFTHTQMYWINISQSSNGWHIETLFTAKFWQSVLLCMNPSSELSCKEKIAVNKSQIRRQMNPYEKITWKIENSF